MMMQYLFCMTYLRKARIRCDSLPPLAVGRPMMILQGYCAVSAGCGVCVLSFGRAGADSRVILSNSNKLTGMVNTFV